MEYRVISRIVSKYLFFFSLTFCIPLIISIYFDYIIPLEERTHPPSTSAFFLTILITLALAFIFRSFRSSEHVKVFRREGVVLVVLIWLLTGVIGGLPYIFSHTFEKPVDAYFETISGLTTTGATVMQAKKFDPITGVEVPYVERVVGDSKKEYIFYGTIMPVLNPETGSQVYTGIEAVSPGILFWRSFTQWIGGMGIVVLFVAILPALGVGGRLLFQAEVPGPIKDSMTPRIKETASIFWKIYIGLTLLQMVALYFAEEKVTWLDAVTISMSTLSTGGFSIHNSGIAYYQSSFVEWVIIAFMILGGLNFTHYVYCLRGKIYRLFEPELGVYLLSLIIFSIWASFYLFGKNVTYLNGQIHTFGIAESLRAGFFQLISAQTSTGFSTVDYSLWMPVPQVLMLGVMYLGGMAGSTSGGVKIIRYCLIFVILKFKVESIFRPEAVRKVRLGKALIDDRVQTTVLGFFTIVMILSFIGTFIYIIDGIDPVTAMTVNTCMINNIGLAFGMAGPSSSFAFLSDFSKIVSIIWMLLGRLEFFVILILFVPGFWKTRK